MNIQWYPGHMAKAKRIMQENISLVDIVIELVDARIPLSSKNPDINLLAKDKFRIIVMNKSDLADSVVNKEWVEYFKKDGYESVLADSLEGKGIGGVTEISRQLMKDKISRLKSRGRIFVPIRAMVVGIPNVGKSTFINKYTGRAITQTGDKPGITKSKQWVKIKKDFELLDTPGILWPKLDSEAVGTRLGITGAINDVIINQEELAENCIDLLMNVKPEAISERYKIQTVPDEKPIDILTKIAKSRCFVLKNAESDLERASITLLDEFRAGKLGRISLEKPEY